MPTNTRQTALKGLAIAAFACAGRVVIEFVAGAFNGLRHGGSDAMAASMVGGGSVSS